MTEDPSDAHLGQAMEGSSIPFDFSPLSTFDAGSVTIIRRQITGLLSVPVGCHPSDQTLGEPCGDPYCRYRALEFALHPDPRGLLRNYADSASDAGLPFQLLLQDLRRDVYTVRSDDAVPIADLSRHPILYRIPVSFRRLRAGPSSSLAWELTRIVRDAYGTSALRLPLSRRLGEDLLVHTDLAADLHIERLGSLQEVLPILSSEVADASTFTRAVDWLLRLADMTGRSRGPDTPIPPYRPERQP